MSGIQLSIVIPIQNIQETIWSTLGLIEELTEGIQTEILVVDRGSTDRSILYALRFLKEQKLYGSVIQGGKLEIGAALNIGIRKASGQYICFLFPEVIKDFFPFRSAFHYLDGDEDLLLLTDSVSEEHVFVSCKETLLASIFQQHKMPPIFYALIRKELLLDKAIFFSEESYYGYDEEFILRVILYSQSIKRIFLLNRQLGWGGFLYHPLCAGIRYLDRIDAMFRVRKDLKRLYQQIDVYQLFCNELLPGIALWCVDMLLKEGWGYGSIQGLFRLKKYDSLFNIRGVTTPAIKKSLLIWKLVPWMYRPRENNHSLNKNDC